MGFTAWRGENHYFVEGEKVYSDETMKVRLPLDKDLNTIELVEEEIKQTLEPEAEIKDEVVTTDKFNHTCRAKGRGGRYAPAGECPRCDQLRGI